MRKALVYLYGVVAMAVLFLPLFPLLFVWPTRRWRRNVAILYSGLWSRSCLRVAGIRVEIHGREHLRTRPAVFIFNHTSMVDFFVNASFAPWHTQVFGKRELSRVPFLGWMWLFSGHPMIVRHKPVQWADVLTEVEEELKTGHSSTLIAPEGTRSRDGKLLPFKKGAFRMAIASGCPIVPVVLKGVAAVHDPEQGLVPGHIDVVVLPPVSTEGWGEGKLGPRIEAIRESYLRELGEL